MTSHPERWLAADPASQRQARADATPDGTSATGGRGRLRVYLGAAPGVGKTYRMLDEGRRRRDRGADVVIGLVETHGRPKTEAMVGDLEIVPRATHAYRGAEFAEMDLDAILARGPAVALVDELAHTNVPGARNAKRWQDVQELLAAGIDVISTVNIQHLESLNDVVEKITGVPQRETVPDRVVRAADQIELVDSSAEALRRRLAHGNVYAPEKIDAALSNYFRVGNLTALRELALLWVADRVDEGLQRYRAEHGIAPVWETRERVVVALTGGVEGATLIRRAARIAARGSGGDLLALHVARSDGLTGADPAALSEQRALVESLGGSYHSVVGDDVPRALLDFARAENATQLVLGTSRRGLLSRLVTGRGIGETTVELSGDIDVHMVTHERSRRGRRRAAGVGGRLTSRRRAAGFAAALTAPALASVVLAQLRAELNLTSQVLVFLAVVVGVARLGGLLPALLGALASSTLLNYFYIPPIHRFTIAEPNNVLALVVFALVAIVVASVVDRASHEASAAAHASAEAETLATLAGSVLRGEDAIPALLERTRETFGMVAVSLLERQPGPLAGNEEAYVVLASAGEPPCRSPHEADVEIPAGDAVLVLRGRPLSAADRRVLTAFATHATVALERSRLAQAASAADTLAAADRMRTALLAAVSHDLRTPLASAKAAVTSLRGQDVAFSPQDVQELLATADTSLDRLDRLVANLLDMSRLQAGALTPRLGPTPVADVVPGVLDSLDLTDAQVRCQRLGTVPDMLADPVLLERVVANLVANAARFNPPGAPILITASALAGSVQLRVVDRGPGLPPHARAEAFQPFQRLGDRDNTSGLGLGLALSRGLAETMGGSLDAEDTPGGGLTMVLTLPSAGEAAAPPEGASEPEVAAMPESES